MATEEKGGESRLTFRGATREDLDAIVRMLADDALGATRETFATPLPASYHTAFEAIRDDECARCAVR